MYVYRQLHTDVIIPEYSIISFASATSFQLLCGSPASLSGNVYERFCATVRTHFECTCEFALVHPTQTATPAELTTHKHTHTHTLEKINENKKKTDTERRQMWRKAMMAQAQQRTQLQTRLIIARAGENSVCVCGREAENTKSTAADDCIGIFIQAARAAYEHTCTYICVRERERGRVVCEFVVVCALRFTFNFTADSVFDFASWCGFPHPLSHSLADDTRSLSLSLSFVRSLEVGFVVSLAAVGF